MPDNSKNPRSTKKIIVAITGATGTIYGVRLLEILKSMPDIETHLIVSAAGAITARDELGMDRGDFKSLADVVHPYQDIGATIASGSVMTAGMVITPCSMNTLGAIANGISGNLIARAADVTLKERRKLILQTRETPLTLSHIRNMASVTEMGGIIAPPVPSFYNRPQTINDIVNQTVGRTLDFLGLNPDSLDWQLVTRWPGLSAR